MEASVIFFTQTKQKSNEFILMQRSMMGRVAMTLVVRPRASL